MASIISHLASVLASDQVTWVSRLIAYRHYHWQLGQQAFRPEDVYVHHESMGHFFRHNRYYLEDTGPDSSGKDIEL